jgi:hypothetical protein
MLANHSTSGGTSASFWNSAAVSSRSAGKISIGSRSVVLASFMVPPRAGGQSDFMDVHEPQSCMIAASDEIIAR